MARRRPKQATFVPRIIFSTACAAGAVPACAVACNPGDVVQTGASASGATSASGSTGHGGQGGAPTTSGMGGVAMVGFSSSSFGTVAASGFGGFGGGGAEAGTTDGSATDGSLDGGDEPDVFFGVAHRGFVVPPADPALRPDGAEPRPAKNRRRPRRGGG